MRICTCNYPDRSHQWSCPLTTEADIDLFPATNGTADPDETPDLGCEDVNGDDGFLVSAPIERTRPHLAGREGITIGYSRSSTAPVV